MSKTTSTGDVYIVGEETIASEPAARTPRFARRNGCRIILSNNIWVTTSGNFFDQALITAVLSVGADHILFASDYPYEMATDAARR